jgi:hypothetical protein
MLDALTHFNNVTTPCGHLNPKTIETYIYYNYSYLDPFILIVCISEIENLNDDFLFDDIKYRKYFYNFIDNKSLTFYKFAIEPTIFNNYSMYENDDDIVKS